MQQVLGFLDDALVFVGVPFLGARRASHTPVQERSLRLEASLASVVVNFAKGMQVCLCAPTSFPHGSKRSHCLCVTTEFALHEGLQRF